MFILGQLINNSVKYADKTSSPTLLFQLRENIGEETIVLSITDNGPGIPNSDLLFVFEKGFTGDRGSYMSRSNRYGIVFGKENGDGLSNRFTNHIRIEVWNNSIFDIPESKIIC